MALAAMLSPGSYGHVGAWGTQAWIDPVKGVAYLLMVQRSNFPNSDASDARREFQKATHHFPAWPLRFCQRIFAAGITLSNGVTHVLSLKSTFQMSSAILSNAWMCLSCCAVK